MAANESPSGGLSPVAIRLIVAPILLVVVVGMLWLHHTKGWSLLTHAFLVAFAAGGAYEFGALMKQRWTRMDLFGPIFASSLLAATGYIASKGSFDTGAVRSGLLAFGALFVLLRHVKHVSGEDADGVAGDLLVLLFVGFFFSSLGELALGPDGAMRLLFVIVVAKASDMGGWLVGKPLGRTKILPAVSPGKSYEGGAGGLLASALCAILLPDVMGLELEASWSILARGLFGALLGAVSLLAGFCWSGFKRRIGTKHSSDLIPEMGGVMDLIDSLLLAGPTALVWYFLAA